MISIMLCVVALLLCYALARRSIADGLGAVIAVGYIYGILRANLPQTFSHFVFDAGALGIYLSEYRHHLSRDVRWRAQSLRNWVVILTIWPCILSILPVQDPLIQLVGLRGNVFFLPFILIGARLETKDWYRLAYLLCYLNLVVFAVAAVEYVVGVEQFFPRGPLTEIIYATRDVAGGTAHRIPSTFSSGHAYGGTMVGTLPLLIAAAVEPTTGRAKRLFFIVASVATILGVFMAAARLFTIFLFVILAVVSLSPRVGLGGRLGGLVVLAVVAFVVMSDVRLQRFTSLSDTDFVAERVQGSVNRSFADLLVRYPMGNGLGAGGTSVPYFLRDRIRDTVGLENEYGRIMLEQGIPGLLLWIWFILWLLARRRAPKTMPLSLGFTLARTACTAFFISGLIGLGMLTGIPYTSILFLYCGWIGARYHSMRRGQRSAVPRQPVPELQLAHG